MIRDMLVRSVFVGVAISFVLFASVLALTAWANPGNRDGFSFQECAAFDDGREPWCTRPMAL